MRWTPIGASAGALVVGVVLGLVVASLTSEDEADPETGPTFRLIDLGSQDTADGVDFVSNFIDVSACSSVTMLAKQTGAPPEGGVPIQMRMTATSPDGVQSVAFFGPATSIGRGGSGVAGNVTVEVPWTRYTVEKRAQFALGEIDPAIAGTIQAWLWCFEPV